MTTMVDIYLPVEDRQILTLSIPPGDIVNFSIRPVKWLRYITFAICGVHGHLSATPNGPPVDYDTIISPDQISSAYYYIPEGDYCFIDPNVMDDQITLSVQTPCAVNFRHAVMDRDGPVCVFTGGHKSLCDAAHLVPRSKGNEYIGVIVQDRFDLYDPDIEPGVLGIDSIENGIFLRKDLHASFAIGHSALLKTPNFALDPADIPRIEADPMPSSRITWHHLVPNTSRFPLPQYDARIVGTDTHPPSTIILDFMYGAAAYQRWGSGQDIKKLMQEHFTDHYESIPIPPAPQPPSNNNSSPEPDNPTDCVYVPNRQPRGRNHDTDMSDGMLQAMDNILALSMLVKGTSPESMAAERQRREEAKELRAKEASRVKVQEWMRSSSPTQ